MAIGNYFLLFNEDLILFIEIMLSLTYFFYLVKVIFIDLLILLTVLIKRLNLILNINYNNIYIKLINYNFTFFCFYNFKYNSLYKENWSIIDAIYFGITYKIIIQQFRKIYINFKYVSFLKAIFFYMISYDLTQRNNKYFFSHFKRDLIKNATKYFHSVCA